MDIQHDSWIKFSVNSFDKSFKKMVIITTVPKTTLRLVSLYLKKQPLRQKKKLNKIFKRELLSAKVDIVLRTTQRVSSCFRFIDAIPLSLLSSSIYKYKCPRCHFRYIGLTYRYWENRQEEHLHMSCIW